jgi:hypothetical protein
MSADPWSNDVPVPTFGPCMVCTRCGIIVADGGRTSVCCNATLRFRVGLRTDSCTAANGPLVAITSATLSAASYALMQTRLCYGSAFGTIGRRFARPQKAAALLPSTPFEW